MSINAKRFTSVVGFTDLEQTGSLALVAMTLVIILAIILAIILQ